jgi:hypothetical protein
LALTPGGDHEGGVGVAALVEGDPLQARFFPQLVCPTLNLTRMETGVAPNAIELHPVLKFVTSNCSS